MNKQFIKELSKARNYLVNVTCKTKFNVELRVAVENIVILIDQIIANPELPQLSKKDTRSAVIRRPKV